MRVCKTSRRSAVQLNGSLPRLLPDPNSDLVQPRFASICRALPTFAGFCHAGGRHVPGAWPPAKSNRCIVAIIACNDCNDEMIATNCNEMQRTAMIATGVRANRATMQRITVSAWRPRGGGCGCPHLAGVGRLANCPLALAGGVGQVHGQNG